MNLPSTVFFTLTKEQMANLAECVNILGPQSKFTDRAAYRAAMNAFLKMRTPKTEGRMVSCTLEGDEVVSMVDMYLHYTEHRPIAGITTDMEEAFFFVMNGIQISDPAP
jgi:hypothetical protein